MKFGKRKAWTAFGALSLALIIVVLVGVALHRQNRYAGISLQASRPVFSISTNADGLHPLLTVVLSNAGPTSLDFKLRWYDCRARSDLTQAASNPGPSPRMPLSSHGTTKLSWEPWRKAPNGEYVCCCQFEWQQHPSWLWGATSKFVDPPLAWVQNCIQPGWKAYTWSLADWLEPLADGLAFTSNILVDDYFLTVYGLDRAKGPQGGDQREASGGASAGLAPGLPRVSPSIEARRAFNSYCVQMTMAPRDQNSVR
jgi:hypothetical protein